MNNKYLELLDDVLNLYRSGLIFRKQDVYQELGRLGKSSDDTFMYLEQVFQKLLADNYIQVDSTNPEFYIIKFDGLVFEGYINTHNNKFESLTRIVELENANRNNAAKLNNLTWWIALGTIIAAIYYVIEIIKNFLPNCQN